MFVSSKFSSIAGTFESTSPFRKPPQWLGMCREALGLDKCPKGWFCHTGVKGRVQDSCSVQMVVKTINPSVYGNCPRAPFSTSCTPGEVTNRQDHRDSNHCVGHSGKWGHHSLGFLLHLFHSPGVQSSRMNMEASGGGSGTQPGQANLIITGQKTTITRDPCVFLS